MWSVLKRSMLVGVLCLAGASGTAYAGFTNVLEVKVPFPFVVGDQTLPAGEYRIQRDDYAPGALMLRSEHGTASAILNTRPASEASPSSDQPSLEFTRGENGGYRLSNVWMPDGMSVTVVR
jgi:hypothetical protein